MKQFFIFLVFLILQSKSVVSQIPDVIQPKTYDWCVFETSIPDSIKLQLINRIESELIDEFKEYEYHTPINNLQNYHVIDYNSDGFYDIIYTGFLGGENEGVIFFQNYDNDILIEELFKYGSIIELWRDYDFSPLNFKLFDFNEGVIFFRNYDNDVLIEELFKYGSIIELWRDYDFSPLNFKLFDFSCCGGIMGSIETYLPTSSNELGFHYELSYKLNFIQGTKFPNEFDISPLLFNIAKEGQQLRCTPIIEDIELNDYTLYGNVIAEYSIGTKGMALASKKDSEGRSWWFVVIFDNSIPIRTKFNQGNNEGPYNSFGWMRNEFLKVIIPTSERL